jgi:hypothetical protein
MRTPCLALIVALAGAVTATSLAEGHGPISVHPDNPRYLLWNGKPTVLVASGEHYGSVINLDFDFRKYLETIASAGLNHTRVMLGDYVEWPGAFSIADNPLAPAEGRFLAPWARSDTPGFSRGGNKFDLDRWDEAYFRRLHEFLDEADRRHIAVEAVLFFVGPGWDHMPLNPKNNVNDTTDAGPKRYLTLENGNLLARQEAYTRKIVRELNRHDNVILNLCNEPWFGNQDRPGFVAQPPPDIKKWIHRVSEWVRDEESQLPNQHILCVDISNQGTVITSDDLTRFFPHLAGFNVHYDANADSLALNPDLSRYLAFNETGFNGIGDDHYRIQGWRYLLSGGAVYSNLDFSFTVGHEDGTATPRFTSDSYDCGGSPTLRKQLGILLDFMNSIPFVRMRRDDSVVVGGADGWNALSEPDKAWAFFFPGEGEIRPGLTLPAGRYRAEWVDILSGEVTTETLESKGWMVRANGQRRGGGAALRVFPASTPPGP